MSFDTELYTRDRPVIDENDSSELARNGAYSWNEEEWLFGGMSATVWPYSFKPGQSGLGCHYEYEEVVPDWVREMRWVVQVSGRNPGDDFFDWLSVVAGSARGVIWSPYRSGDDALEHVDGFDAHWAALRMIRATRPVYSDTDDRTRDLIRRDRPADAALARMREEASALLGRVDTPNDQALADAYREQFHRARAVADAQQAVVYGADLDTVVRSGLRLSRQAVRHLYLAAPVEADADAAIWFSLYEEPVHGRRDAGAFARLAEGLDAAELASAEIPPLPDSAAIRNELVAFWERVIELDPRLDPAELGDELRRRRMEE